MRVAARRGLEDVSLRHVAAEAGVTAGMVQHYFRTKDEMMVFAIGAVRERVEQRWPPNSCAQTPPGCARPWPDRSAKRSNVNTGHVPWEAAARTRQRRGVAVLVRADSNSAPLGRHARRGAAGGASTIEAHAAAVAPHGRRRRAARVTVIGPSLTAADIDATAAFALGRDAVHWLRSRGHTALVVDADGATAGRNRCGSADSRRPRPRRNRAAVPRRRPRAPRSRPPLHRRARPQCAVLAPQPGPRPWTRGVLTDVRDVGAREVKFRVRPCS